MRRATAPAQPADPHRDRLGALRLTEHREVPRSRDLPKARRCVEGGGRRVGPLHAPAAAGWLSRSPISRFARTQAAKTLLLACSNSAALSCPACCRAARRSISWAALGVPAASRT